MTSYCTNYLINNNNENNKIKKPLSFYITQEEKKEVMTKNEIDNLRDSVSNH